MALPKIIQKLFSDAGKGTKLNSEIIPPLKDKTSEELFTFIGEKGELTYNTTEKRLVVHDGSTKGGVPAAKKSEIVDAKSELQQAIDNAVAEIGGTIDTIEGSIERIETEYLPLTGGTLKGALTLSTNTLLANRNINNSGLVICGGTDASNGAYVHVFGKDATNNKGYLWLNAVDGVNTATVLLTPDRKFELNGTSVNRLSMPDYSSAIHFTSSTYTAPKDGWIFIAGTCGDHEQWSGVFVDGVRIGSITSWAGTWAGTTFSFAFPVAKGSVVTGLGGNNINVSELVYCPVYGM